MTREDTTGMKTPNPTTAAEIEAHPDTDHHTTRTKGTTTADANQEAEAH